jgi:hypothetical protein
MLSWIKKNKQFLSIRAIEESIKMPHDTLQKAVLNKQILPKKWMKPLEDWVKNFVKIKSV